MGNDFCTTDYVVKTDTRRIDVTQALLYVVEINDEMANRTGVDLVSAAAAGIDSKDAAKIVRELGLTGRAYVKRRGGKSYLILKGNPGQRATLRGTRYLTTNPKVAHISISPKALAKGAARMTGLAVIAYVALNVVEAILKDGDVRFSTLFGNVAADIVKFGLAAAAGYLAGAAVGAITTVAAGPLIAAVFVGVLAGIAIDHIDREFGLSEKLVRSLEKAADKVKSPFEYLAYELARWERHLINQAIKDTLRYR